ncbi:MAG: hypothetical protein LUH05_05450 [Candidatus Gastranaerophilales bacterium]|nr:hypothetical protein [Candidatus Gastranaerophilales bacterium]
MKTIKKLEQAKKENANLKEWGINRTFYWAYRSALETGNDLIDLNDVVWDKDVREIVNNCKEFGIDEITISSNYSGVIQTLGLFEEQGCKITGLKKVKSQYTDFNTQEYKIVSAIVIQISQK